MKKIFFSLVLTLLAFQVNAASITLAAGGEGQPIFDQASDAGRGPHTINLEGAPTGDVWTTSLSIVDVAAGSVAGFGAELLDSTGALLHTFTGTGDGVTLDLALGSYTVNFLGDVTPGSFWTMLATIEEVQTSAVPVPAAVWLFGSALMGLVGVSRRKSTAVAA